MEIFVCFSFFNASVHGAIRDAAHRLYQGILYVRHVAKFRGERVNVIPFTYVRKGTAYTELTLYETHKHSTALCASLLYRTVPKYENKCGNYGCT